jgi:zinc protease
VKLLAIPVLAACGLAFAQPAPSPIPKIKFSDTKLDNGLRVIIAEDHYAPVYAIVIAYKVGSRDERKGRTGFAHLFEHMMFKGSENVGVGELDFLTFTNGGSSNGTTDTDRTLYYEVFPKNQLDLGLFLEADRMHGLVINQENLENQRQAVKEERRLRVDNQPYGQTSERTEELVYDNFAYHHSVIGSMADLDAASVDDVKQFFKTYYAPNNAVLALVGDLDTKDTLTRVKKYFGGIPRQDPPKPVDLTEPAKDGERRLKLDDPLARLTRLDIAYRIGKETDTDARAMSITSTILAGGISSRLYQKLVQEKQVVTNVGAGVDRRGGPGTFRIFAMIRPGKDPAEVEGLISEEIAKLHAELVTPKELQRVRMGIRRGAINRQNSALGRAEALANYAAIFDDPNLINTDPEALLSITAEDIQKAVKTDLVNANRVVVVTQPSGAGAGQKGGPGGPGGPKDK